MSGLLDRYREITKEILRMRADGSSLQVDEDSFADEAEDLWWRMTKEERNQVDEDVYE